MTTDALRSIEIPARAPSGWLMLFLGFAAIPAAVGLIAAGVTDGLPPYIVAPGVIGLLVFAGISFTGLFTLRPNEARVLILFGKYKGTVRESGFHWANPLYSRGASTVISLRVHNFNSDTLKVNDKRGNPVEIAAVVVWRVEDTAQAAFDVEDYRSYVQVQSESAIRGIASLYAYDQQEGAEPTLRSGGDQVSHALKTELQVRLAKAGVVVEEARLTHLAYAPEIASAMLRRQQADAIIEAREKIVLGAVGMVQMALAELSAANVVQLDEERKAAMVSNLLVVLCGTSEAAPVINTGTLYG